MKRVALAALIALAGCRNVVGPETHRDPSIIVSTGCGFTYRQPCRNVRYPNPPPIAGASFKTAAVTCDPAGVCKWIAREDWDGWGRPGETILYFGWNPKPGPFPASLTLPYPPCGTPEAAHVATCIPWRTQPDWKPK